MIFGAKLLHISWILFCYMTDLELYSSRYGRCKYEFYSNVKNAYLRSNLFFSLWPTVTPLLFQEFPCLQINGSPPLFSRILMTGSGTPLAELSLRWSVRPSPWLRWEIPSAMIGWFGRLINGVSNLLSPGTSGYMLEPNNEDLGGPLPPEQLIPRYGSAYGALTLLPKLEISYGKG